jgi:hypothetical protein
MAILKGPHCRAAVQYGHFEIAFQKGSSDHSVSEGCDHNKETWIKEIVEYEGKIHILL